MRKFIVKKYSGRLAGRVIKKYPFARRLQHKRRKKIINEAKQSLCHLLSLKAQNHRRRAYGFSNFENYRLRVIVLYS